ncbi:50S ribosomal protein L2 [Candidatus Sumerlaeota bacterium]|nr:50S ribosomal protein L2 [Candidatus Sumerlaeota bacterium]
MGIKAFRPLTPTQRTMTVLANEELTRSTPEKSLISAYRKQGGRNNHGHVTQRFRGGGHKRAYRLVDFKRIKDDVPAKVVSVEYDPNRSANIALLNYTDGAKSYIIAPVGIKVGQMVLSGPKAEIIPGNVLPLRNIPVGTTVCCVELKPGKGSQMAKSAGASVQLMAKEGERATLRLPSSEVRMVDIDCRAMIGQVGNLDYENVAYGKAGRKRWLGKRPHNRGVAMNPIDHPMGGGEGKTSGGRHPCSPWGQLAKGLLTRNPRRRSNSMIIRRRKK